MLFNIRRELLKELSYQRITYLVLANRMGVGHQYVRNKMHQLNQIEEFGAPIPGPLLSFYLKAASALNCKVIVSLVPQTTQMQDEQLKEKRNIEVKMAAYFQGEVQERKFGSYTSSEKNI